MKICNFIKWMPWQFVIVGSLLTCRLWAQDLVVNPDSLLQLANDAVQARQFDEAFNLYERAGEFYFNDGNPAGYLQCRVEMARSAQFTSTVSREAMGVIIQPAIDIIVQDSSLMELPVAAQCYQFKARYLWSIRGNYDDAILAYDTALIICEVVGDSADYLKMATYTDLSHVYSNQEAFGPALDYADKALELSKLLFGADHVENGARHYSLGFTYYRSGNYDKAVREIRKGISILEDGAGPEMQIGLGYNNLSAVYVAMLDQEGAQQSAQASEQILSKYLGPGHEAFANVNWDLAVMYADLDQFDLGQHYAAKAIESFERNFGPEFPQLPDLYHHMGFCLDKQGLFQSANKWHQKALDRKLSVFGTNHVRSIESYRRLAEHYLEQGALVEADKFVQRSLQILGKMKTPSQLTSAWIADIHARILQAQGDFTAAETAFEKAIESVCVAPLDRSIALIDQTFNPFFYTEFNQKKAKLLYLGYREKGDFNLLIRSVEACRETHHGLRRLRRSYRNNEAKIFLQKRAREHYDLMLEVLHRLWAETHELKYLEEAWNISEQSKSLLLFEAWKSEDLFSTTMPSELHDSLQTLQQAVSFHLKGMMDHLANQDSTAAATSRVKYFSYVNRQASLEDFISDHYPGYEQMINDLQPVSVTRLQQRLSSDMALVEYYLADSTLHVFTISPGDLNWTRRTLNPNFLEILQSFIRDGQNLEAILRDPHEALTKYKEVSSEIFRILIPHSTSEIIREAQKLVIIPDRELGYLSFDGLYGSFLGNEGYLVRKFAITYAFSGSLFYLHAQNARPYIPSDLVAFAPSYDDSGYENDLIDEQGPSRMELGSLPGARREVESIMDVMKGKSWFDEDATEQNFKLVAADHSILHLALHGLVDEESPIRSSLQFARTDESDGQLSAYEIYPMHLGANLAVLSACNTGSGKLASGEGILSLSRAFAFAGVPNLIANLWRSDDDAASQIMISFYRGLQNGLTKDVALQNAKIDFMDDQKTDARRHPYFWATHILLGENTAKFRARGFLSWLILPIGLLAIVLIIYLRKTSG